MNWLYEQVYHFNVLAVFVTVAASAILSRMSMTKEMKAISEEIYKNAEEIKDEIRSNSR